MRRLLVLAVLAAVLGVAGPASGQEPAPDAPAPLTENMAEILADTAAAAPAALTIPAGTVLQIELGEPLSSRSAQIGQLFGLRLAAPILIDGREVAPAGAPGGGEVIDAHAAAFGGRQGRLIISGRYIEIGGVRARIRGMQITANGDDRVGTALAVTMIPYAGIAGIFVQGGEVDIPVGARGTARLAADVDVAIEPSAGSLEPAEPLSEETPE